jgi:flagellar protein FliO/FliZ
MRAMDVLDLGRYFASLLLVGGLLGVAWLAARRFGVPGVMQGTTQKRLSVVETLMIGPRHKLFLLRRDGVEHLLLIGPQGANVVENGIPAELLREQLEQPLTQILTMTPESAV